MSTGPGVCPNCGAPLELDENGDCAWCHARLRSPLSRSRYVAELPSQYLVPAGVDNCATSSPFVYLTMAALGMLGTQPTVQEYVTVRPGLRQDIRELSAAVSAAGVRVRDAGLLRDSFEDNLRPTRPPRSGWPTSPST